MSFAPVLPPPGSAKPSLAGVHIKQRKGQAKASSKFEPGVFRNAIINHLSSCAPNDYDSISAKLDSLGSQLDFRKYEEQLFQILLVGAVLAPGGSIEEGEVGRCVFSIASIGGDSNTVDIKELKKAVGVFERLMRRYKYLQHDFEEASLKQILGYAGKFTPIEQQRLAAATALFIQAGIAPPAVIGAVRTAHLVKEGTAQTVLVQFLKSYVQTGEPIDQVLIALRKAGLSDFDQFFPAGKRSAADVTAALKGAGLNSVSDWYLKQKTAVVRDEVNKKIKSLLADNADVEEILSIVEPIAARSVPSIISEGDFVSLVFLALVSRLNLNAEGAAAADEALVQVKEYAGALEPFAQKAVSEVALINTIQLWVNDNPKLVPAFLRILKTLYSEDVLSTQALVYWYQKGSKPAGREQLLAKAEPLIKFLQEQEQESEDEDEDDE